jgi:hypothetical protein
MMKKHKALRIFMILTVLFMQIAFLAMIVKEQYELNKFAFIVLILIITLTLLFGYKYLDLYHDEYNYD